jgi:hypothetical protein
MSKLPGKFAAVAWVGFKVPGYDHHIHQLAGGSVLSFFRQICAKRWALIAGLMLHFVNVAPACGAETRAPSVKKLKHLSEFFEGEIAARKISSAIVLILQRGRPVFLRTFGVRDVRTNSR